MHLLSLWTVDCIFEIRQNQVGKCLNPSLKSSLFTWFIGNRWPSCLYLREEGGSWFAINEAIITTILSKLDPIKCCFNLWMRWRHKEKLCWLDSNLQHIQERVFKVEAATNLPSPPSPILGKWTFSLSALGHPTKPMYQRGCHFVRSIPFSSRPRKHYCCLELADLES